MTNNSALNGAIRKARHLLFAFDGPIRCADSGKPADSNTPTAPYIHEVLTACHESGRSAVILTPKPSIDVPAYLDANDLFAQITPIAASVADAINFLEIAAADCLLITSSPVDISTVHAEGAPSIGYAATPDDAAHLIDAGAGAVVYSMADIALTLRAHPLPN